MLLYSQLLELGWDAKIPLLMCHCVVVFLRTCVVIFLRQSFLSEFSITIFVMLRRVVCMEEKPKRCIPQGHDKMVDTGKELYVLVQNLLTKKLNFSPASTPGVNLHARQNPTYTHLAVRSIYIYLYSTCTFLFIYASSTFVLQLF